MGYVNVFVASEAYIHVENKQLVLSGAKQMSFPLEDINSVIVENRNTQVSVCALTEIAAAVYFKALFGKDFVRSADCNTNFALNYGYAVMRGLVARTIVCHGFEPSLGIFHCNELNPFNLADDLMEPLRPVVDLFAFTYPPIQVIQSVYKKEICNLMNADVLSGGERHSVTHSVERMISSFAKSLYSGEADLQLPQLLPLFMHEYE